jgi:hypothetical protein
MMNVETKTRLKLSFMVFVAATFFFATGLWKENCVPQILEGKVVEICNPQPLLSQDNWVLLSLSILGIYVAGKTVSGVTAIRNNNGK